MVGQEKCRDIQNRTREGQELATNSCVRNVIDGSLEIGGLSI